MTRARMRWLPTLVLLFVIPFVATSQLTATPPSSERSVEQSLQIAGDNRPQVQSALERIPLDQRVGLEHLLRYMSDDDLRSLSADFLVENVEFAYRAWREAPWHDQVSEELFLNEILPFANVNERRDRWRKDFFERFRPLVSDIKTPGAAAVRLNQKIFDLVHVHYSTKRRKADQSPYESMETGLASCTGLSILLIDACRSVGVPARFVGIPMWTDGSGNHSWVEVWDDGWHFTGAAEPSGDALDQAWFVDRATLAQRDQTKHAIYAVSFRTTPQPFPLVWRESLHTVSAVNVTDRYVGLGKKIPPGYAALAFRVLNGSNGQRCAAKLQIRDTSGQVLFEGTAKDERFDANDHVTVPLPLGKSFEIVATHDGQSSIRQLAASNDAGVITLQLASGPATPTDVVSGPVAELQTFLQQPLASRGSLAEQPFAQKDLTRQEAHDASLLCWKAHREQQTTPERLAEWKSKVLKIDTLTMPFEFRIFGEAPPTGHAVYISMHGGGNAPAAVNDQQWRNQVGLYSPEEGIYLCPRAPTNTWNLWHEAHIDRFFDQLIQQLIAIEGVDPNRVYLMGYSAGGDGVYQLAPRMADRFAAASMMAGHPNETRPLSLRNLPFAIHMGALDNAYRRNEVAREWGSQLDALQTLDPEGYLHQVQLHANKGHWMERQDGVAVPWMAQFTRQPFPRKIVWLQDDVTHGRFYWLSIDPKEARAGQELRARIAGQRIDLLTGTEGDSQEPTTLTHVDLLLNDQLVDLDQPIDVYVDGQLRASTRAVRTITAIAQTLAEYGDPTSIATATLRVALTH